LIVCAALVFAGPCYGTDTLAFDGGGYSLLFAVSADQGTIVNIHFAAPGAQGLTTLESGFKVSSFDLRKRHLTVQYPGTDAAPSLPPFRLEVKGRNGTLFIRGKRIRGKFDWTM
jgi:hypothetical protein